MCSPLPLVFLLLFPFLSPSISFPLFPCSSLVSSPNSFQLSLSLSLSSSSLRLALPFCFSSSHLFHHASLPFSPPVSPSISLRLSPSLPFQTGLCAARYLSLSSHLSSSPPRPCTASSPRQQAEAHPRGLGVRDERILAGHFMQSKSFVSVRFRYARYWVLQASIIPYRIYRWKGNYRRRNTKNNIDDNANNNNTKKIYHLRNGEVRGKN